LPDERKVWQERAVEYARIMSRVKWTPVADGMPNRRGGYFKIKSRSKAVQTFGVELAGGGGFGCLPTRRSVAEGAYGAIPESTQIGPEGGNWSNGPWS